MSVYPNSLNRHVARRVMVNFLDRNVSPVAPSLVLAHTLPQTTDEASPTTREYYLTSQRMDTKRDAMVALSESMTAAVKRTGDTLPAPMETTHAKRSLHSK